ncbi:FAD-binding protein [Yasminevirus sp. GU-2018]|uniref:FAD-binding protein n=1 Tax=Yasminevirus sp. GU-2018 TaxID=2420051 RepID=A0A5K0U7V1_9VIRU|nr:FAD-binding protein [Yasminevirus sp. GU-2018]
MRYYFDVVVIGGGPAGLGTACALAMELPLQTGSAHSGRSYIKRSFVVIDSGKRLFKRDRNNKRDIVTGIGGAGLFSDGKFSFFPSSSMLWRLPNRDVLRDAYMWYKRLLSNYNDSVPDFPDSLDAPTSVSKSGVATENSWHLKEYLSIYLSLEERYDLINRMVNIIGESNIMTETEIIDYTTNHKGEHVLTALTPDEENPGKTREIQIVCRNIVVAGGRFWPMFSRTGQPNTRFMRLEYGVRVQGSPDLSIFTETKIKDPKYKYESVKCSFDKIDEMKENCCVNIPSEFIKDVTQSSPGIEYRTFCCCRNGEVVVTEFNELETCSGRADCEPTKESNIGFNVRVKDPVTAALIGDTGFLKEGGTFTDVPMKTVLKLPTSSQSNIIEKHFGTEGAKHLVTGLKKLCERFPDLERATLSGPTLEGVGYYPETNDELRMRDQSVWVVGDACGKFRGITASVVSGYYVGLNLGQMSE